LLLAAAALYAMALLHHPHAGWNVNSRLNLVYAIVFEGKVSIDSWHLLPGFETEDKAFVAAPVAPAAPDGAPAARRAGHYYSDKVFGLSMASVPFAWVLQFVGVVPGPKMHYLLRVLTVSVPAAASVALLFLLMARLGVAPRRAALLVVLGFFGTMWFGYSTVFYPYALGLACLLGALWIVLFPPAERVTPANAAAAGALLGYAMVCDYIFLFGVMGVGALFLFRLLDQGGLLGMRAFSEMKGMRSRPPQLVVLALCAAVPFAIPIACFLAYCHALFGSFSIPYQHMENARFQAGHARGFLGASWPDLHVLYRLTVHPFRGLFVWSPLVAVAIAACWLATRSVGKRRVLGWLGLWMAAAYLLFNSGYYMWWGGWGMGPRFLIPMLPFVLIGLGELDPDRTRPTLPAWLPRVAAWRAAVAIGVLGVALSVPLSLTDPQLPQGNQDPALAQATWSTHLHAPQGGVVRAVYAGRVSINPMDRIREAIAAESRGEAYGWLALWLVPVAGLLIAAWHVLPAKTPFPRVDYPFKTVDASIQPAALP
jgi:hypothetical protein